MSIVAIDLYYSKEGHVLAEDIFNKHGAAIVKAYTTLNSFIIEKLQEFEIKIIKIFEPESSCNSTDLSLKFKKSYEGKALEAKEILSEAIATEKVNHKKLTKLTDSIYSEIGENDYIVNCLSDIRNSDEYTYYHCLNVSFFSALIGRWLKLSEVEILNIIKSGLLHDIGKIKVPIEIINKKGKLLPNEYDEIKRHAIYGFNIINRINNIGVDVKNAVLMHHEREDGSGYPFGYSRDQINKSSKIVAIADVYDAMTSERVYGKKATPFDAFEMFMTEGIKLFDTNIVNTFLKNIVPYYVGSKVVLNTGVCAEVVYIPFHCITKPVVKVGNRFIDLSIQKEYTITACYF